MSMINYSVRSKNCIQAGEVSLQHAFLWFPFLVMLLLRILNTYCCGILVPGRGWHRLSTGSAEIYIEVKTTSDIKQRKLSWIKSLLE